MTALGPDAKGLPTIACPVGPGTMTPNGEIPGQAASTVTDKNNVEQTFEDGSCYTVLSGDGADEGVGIGVEALLCAPQFMGFAPELGLRYEKTSLNGASNDRRLSLRIKSAF